MKDPRRRAGLGVKGGVPGGAERDLAVERGLYLEDFCKAPQSVRTAMRKTGFQVSGQRVSMLQGGPWSSSQTLIPPFVLPH